MLLPVRRLVITKYYILHLCDVVFSQSVISIGFDGDSFYSSNIIFSSFLILVEEEFGNEFAFLAACTLYIVYVVLLYLYMSKICNTLYFYIKNIKNIYLHNDSLFLSLIIVGRSWWLAVFEINLDSLLGKKVCF